MSKPCASVPVQLGRERTRIQIIHNVRTLPITLVLSGNTTRNPSRLAFRSVLGTVVLLDHGRFRDVRDGECRGGCRCDDKGADECSFCDSGFVVVVVIVIVGIILVVKVCGIKRFSSVEVCFCSGWRDQRECFTVPFTRDKLGGWIDGTGRFWDRGFRNDVEVSLLVSRGSRVPFC